MEGIHHEFLHVGPGFQGGIRWASNCCLCESRTDVTCQYSGLAAASQDCFAGPQIGGNFLIPLACQTIRMEDKLSLVPFIEEHSRIYGKQRLSSLGADKGYYSKANVRAAAKFGVMEIGIQCPGNVKVNSATQDIDLARRLRDRRAGIEPLIGHAKRMGLGRSRMKSDSATLVLGHRSVMAFNLSQIERRLTERKRERA